MAKQPSPLPSLDVIEADVRQRSPDATHFCVFHAPILRGWLDVVAESDEHAIQLLHARGSGPCEVYKITEDGREVVFP